MQLDTLDGQSMEALLGYIHVFESPAGPVENYQMKLITDTMESQEPQGVIIKAKMITPKANAKYLPRVLDEVPSVFATLLP